MTGPAWTAVVFAVSIMGSALFALGVVFYRDKRRGGGW
jgi:hypothetical protein